LFKSIFIQLFSFAFFVPAKDMTKQ